jgi:hypothetical protein
MAAIPTVAQPQLHFAWRSTRQQTIGKRFQPFGVVRMNFRSNASLAPRLEAVRVPEILIIPFPEILITPVPEILAVLN